MKHKRVSLRLGRGRAELRVPASADVLRPPPVPPLADPDAAICEALDTPIGCPPLEQLIAARRPKSVAISISDITRPVPNEVIVRSILDRCNRQGVADGQIVILIATGMHRPSTPTEREHLLGTALVRRCAIVDHRADDAASVRAVSRDPPVRINQRFLDADFRIVTGLIEPHFMAGFSGGRKGICPGLADLVTVQRFHGYQVMADPRADNGLLEGNPCHIEALRVARLVGCDFLANVAIGHDRQPVGFFCGDLEAAHLAGCQQVARWSNAQIDAAYDLVVTTGGGYPLDATYYQTVKGMVSALPATDDRSTLVVLSACDEGIGSPEYEQLMRRWATDWQRFLDTIRQSDHVAKDQWQLQMQTRALARLGAARVRLVCDGLSIDTQRAMGVEPIVGDGPAVARCQRLIDQFVEARPEARIALIPEGPYTLLNAPLSGA